MEKKYQLSPVAKELFSVFESAALEKRATVGEETIKVSEAISSVAFLYEKIRNVIDYKEDHLLRIAAIERALYRRLPQKNNYQKMAESLIEELTRSGYLKNRSISFSKINKISKLMEKYFFLIEKSKEKDSKATEIINWILSLASCEIENELVPQEEDSALVAAFYQLLGQSVKSFPEQNKFKNIQLYIASQRTLLKPSLATLRYNLLLGYLPNWAQNDQKNIDQLTDNIDRIKNEIEEQIVSSQADRLYHFCRRYAAPFLILREVLYESPLEAKVKFTNPDELEKLINDVCQRRYREIKSKLTRTAVRSIIYIFLTKMMLALFLELPFELLITHQIRTLPLIINSLFPPALMFAFVLSVPKPGEKNTLKIVEKVKEIAYQGTFKTREFYFNPPKVSTKSFRNKVFKFFYFLTFFLSFGLIIWLLLQLNFNFFSILVFLFFLTVISFFAYKISLVAREMIVEEKETPLSALADFAMIPILRTGRKLSQQLEKINILNFVLDFFIEAPLKSIFEIGEEWLAYLREKKEEIM